MTQQKVTLVIYCTNFFPLFIEISLAKSLILRKRGMLKSVVGYVCICMHIRLCDQCLWFTLTYRNPSCCVKGCVVSGSRRSRHVCGRSHLPSLVRPPPNFNPSLFSSTWCRVNKLRAFVLRTVATYRIGDFRRPDWVVTCACHSQFWQSLNELRTDVGIHSCEFGARTSERYSRLPLHA